MTFAHSRFAQFIATTWGRGLRIIAGVALIGVGLTRVEGVWGWVVALLGLGPLYAGAFDKCLLAPLFGAPFDGEELRHAAHR